MSKWKMITYRRGIDDMPSPCHAIPASQPAMFMVLSTSANQTLCHFEMAAVRWLAEWGPTLTCPIVRLAVKGHSKEIISKRINYFGNKLFSSVILTKTSCSNLLQQQPNEMTTGI